MTVSYRVRSLVPTSRSFSESLRQRERWHGRANVVQVAGGRCAAPDGLRNKMKLMVIGSGGRLGAALMRAYQNRFDVAGFNHAELDLAKPDQIRRRLGDQPFDVLINAAAFTNVDAL